MLLVYVWVYVVNYSNHTNKVGSISIVVICTTKQTSSVTAVLKNSMFQTKAEFTVMLETNCMVCIQ